jgi:histidinol-phosphate aminotransferase
VIAELLKVKDSYNLSRIALAAGSAALGDAAWMRRNVERVRQTRAETERRLRALGFEVPPSEANFVLARMPGRDLGPIARSLRRAGILVRHFSTPMLRDALRISIGKPSEMHRLIAVLRDLVPAASGRAGRSRRR